MPSNRFRLSTAALLLALAIPQKTSAQFATILNLPPDPDIGDNQSIGSHTQVNLADGGSIGESFSLGNEGVSSTDIELNITGGSVGRFLTTYDGSTVNISGGTVGPVLYARSGSRVNVSGGFIANELNADEDTIVNISGGYLHRLVSHGVVSITGNPTFEDIIARAGAVIDIQSGTFNNTIRSRNGGILNISGGTFGDQFGVSTGGIANITGGTIGEEAFLLGTINLSGGTIGNRASNVASGFGAVLNMSGGSIGDDLNLGLDVSINMTGGSIGDRFRLQTINQTKISGGTIGNDFTARFSDITMTGGSIGDNFSVTGSNTSSRGVLDIYGGSIGSNFSSDYIVNLYGGSVQNDFYSAGNTFDLNVFGTQFFLDGLDITSLLTPNVPLLINTREVNFSGLLADGSPFDFYLEDPPVLGIAPEHARQHTNLTITFVQPGDFNGSLNVDGLDFLAWQRGLNNPIDLADLADWEANFGNTPAALTPAATTIPEPTTLTLLFFTLAILYTRHRQF